MRTQSLISVLMAAAVGRVAAQEEDNVTGELGDAQVVEGNPPGVVYEAHLPEEPFFEGVAIDGNVEGSIVAATTPDGVGVEYRVRFANLPQDGGLLSYHIHSTPVPEDGNCTGTLAHLDPYIRHGSPPCNPDVPESCEVGDLSGKYGLIDPSEGDPFEAVFVDPYSSLIEGQGAFFGNRSFVLHFATNLTRISCANFALVAGDPTDPGHGGGDNCTANPEPSHVYPPHPESSSQVPGAPHPTNSLPVTPVPTGIEPVPTGGAAAAAVPVGLVGAVVMGALFGM